MGTGRGGWGRSVNISEGLRKRRRERGMLYQGKVVKKNAALHFKKKPTSFLWRSPRSAATRITVDGMIVLVLRKI